jgi:hypothetical protein
LGLPAYFEFLWLSVLFNEQSQHLKQWARATTPAYSLPARLPAGPPSVAAPPPTTIPRSQVTISVKAKSAYLVYNDLWVAFDMPQSMYMKIKAAEALGLGGLMVGGSGRVGACVSPLQGLPAQRAGGRVGGRVGLGCGRLPGALTVLACGQQHMAQL